MASGHRENLSAARSAFKTLVLCLPALLTSTLLLFLFLENSSTGLGERGTRACRDATGLDWLRSMGCSRSKQETDRENLPPGFFPIQRTAMEVRRRLRPGRRLSIASSTELLCSEDADGEYDLVATPSAAAAAIAEEEEGGKKLAAMEPVEKAETLEAEEEKGKRLWRAVAEDEQLPGSPSFRFYFVGSTDDGSAILQREDTEKSKHTVDGSKHRSLPVSSTRENSDTEQGKTKAKRKSKLRALTKAPMIHMLNARSHSAAPHARDHQAP